MPKIKAITKHLHRRLSSVFIVGVYRRGLSSGFIVGVYRRRLDAVFGRRQQHLLRGCERAILSSK
jgi:hypothetical protein